MPQMRPPKLSSLFALLVLFVTCASSVPAQNPPPRGTQSTTSLHLVWPAQQGVLRYRLQLARDEAFQDIVFDRAVFGTEYLVADLSPGRYYWRVAPAVKETGKFTPPRAVDITGQANTVSGGETRIPTTPPEATIGWRTTTGPISQPLVAHLRSGSSFDVVGVNADGMAYGLDGENGTALWAARFRPNAKRGEPTGNGGAVPFRPVLIEGRGGLTNVVVAYEGGVRALEGATGRELWRSPVGGSAFTGALATPEGASGACGQLTLN